MTAILPIVLMAFAGVLLGGAWSLHRQGAARANVALMGVLSAVALVAGILWLFPGDG